MSNTGVRTSVARSVSRRGAGLGNEIVPLAKSYIGAHVLGAKIATPMWAFNKYGITRQLGFTRTAAAGRQAATLMARRTVTVTEQMYRSVGELDYGDCLQELQSSGTFDKSSVVVHGGMWGGYRSIVRARPYLLGLLSGAPGVAPALYTHELSFRHKQINVAVHVRLGDFTDNDVRPGHFNTALPLPWYSATIAAVMSACRGLPVKFWLFTNGDRSQLRHLTDMPEVEIADLDVVPAIMFMTRCDLLICSVSSMSMLAALLSDKPYIWNASQLYSRAGHLTLWGREETQLLPNSPTSAAIGHSPTYGRGIPMSDTGDIPTSLADYLAATLEARGDMTSDLLMYGAIREKPFSPSPTSP